MYVLRNHWVTSPIYPPTWYSETEWGFIAITSHIDRIWMTEVIFRTDTQLIKINRSSSYTFEENGVVKENHSSVIGFALFVFKGK